ncbi:glycosyltransferase family 39 protein [Francisella sp. LA112445]|uniref:glycosyltransferase family 39 protein n=1 Tax=Francisella sp. LA112445 TaxID=1395624 RepID=UPI001788B876|nr:glycosyltransferase family 39 protein [Francisella sp. LA112445]QIW09668.1 hypothetical protein FIP56_02840 [Francisella sp. LA112445]
MKTIIRKLSGEEFLFNDLEVIKILCIIFIFLSLFFAFFDIEVFILNLLLLFLTLLFIKDRSLLKLITLILLIYSVNNALQYYLQIDASIYKPIYSDETFFYKVYRLNSFSFEQVFNSVGDSSSPLIIYVMSTISLFVETLGGNVSILFLKQIIISISVINIIFVYKIINFYFNKNDSFKLALIYSLLSFQFVISTLLLRDQFVALSFSMFFYLYLKENSWKPLLFMILIIVASFFMRYQTGLFLIVFLLGYMFNFLRVKALFFFLLVFSIVLYFKISWIIGYLSPKIEGYSNLVHLQAAPDSLGRVLYDLPYGLNYLVLSFFSQIQPFPVWAILNNSSMNFIFKISYILSSVFWYFVFMSLLFGILRYKLLFNLDKKLLTLLLISFLYIALASSMASDIRRLYIVYPIFFLSSSYSYIFLIKRKKNYMFFAVLSYLFLIFVYLLLKLLVF